MLRTLARGGAAEFLLGHRAESDPSLVVIRRPIDVADPRTERVLAAYAGIEHAHVARLVDVGADERGAACAVLERLPDDLPALLLRREVIGGGEAVTLLAPIVMAVDALHAAGIAHGSLSAACVRFRDDGAPVLVGFGAAALFAAGSPEVVRERVPEVVRDREALRELALAVLGLVDRAVPAELARRIRNATPSRLGSELLDALATLGPPVAIGHPGPASPVASGSITPAEDDLDGAADADDAVTEPAIDRLVDRPGRLGGVAAVVRRLAEPVIRAGPVATVRANLGERWRSLTTRTRRIAVAGVVGVAALAIASASSPDAHLPPSTGATSPAVEPSASAVAPDPVLTGDDPLAATRVLVRERDRCIRLAARSCLDAIDQPGSPAAASDRALIASLVDGVEPPPSAGPGSLSIIQRWGDTALISTRPGRRSGLAPRDEGRGRMADQIV